MSDVTQQIVTPKGILEWVYISGEGRENLKGEKVYQASVKFKDDDPAFMSFKEDVLAFFNENKPKEYKGDPFSIGIKPILDEDDNETGESYINAWTSTKFKDGKPNIIKVVNSKAAEVFLGEKLIGNGSEGRLSVTMKVYEQAANVGVSLFLNGVQVTKFIEYSQDLGFEADESDGAWLGEDEDTGFEPSSDRSPKSEVKKVNI